MKPIFNVSLPLWYPKFFLCFVVLLLHTSSLIGQEDDYKQVILDRLDSLLVEIESIEGASASYDSIRILINELRNQDFREISESTIDFIRNEIPDYRFLGGLRANADYEISKYRYQKPGGYHGYIEEVQKKRERIDGTIRQIVTNDYLHYDYHETSDKLLKYIHLYHDNDVFLFSNINKDRDYTGGFRLEFATDRLKIKLFKFGKRDHNYLHYQSFLIGGEGYTPYIRFTEDELLSRNVLYEIDPTTNFFTQRSLDSIQNYLNRNQQLADRPFASFQYIGRGKYKLHHNGNYRRWGFLKIGKVGGPVGENIQAIIHNDLTTGSQRVLNWSNQIANGGRFAVNLEWKSEFSLLSENSYIVNFKKNPEAKKHRILKHVNVYVPVEFALGTVHTHAGGGIGISNKSFLNTNGTNDVKFVNYRGLHTIRRIWLNTYINVEYNYRHVIHNSMLEGMGIINPFGDDPLDDEAVTVYKLREEDINRNLHSLSWQIGIRVKRMTIFYKQVRLFNKEFSVEGAKPVYEEFQTEKWYGYGRLGASFIM